MSSAQHPSPEDLTLYVLGALPPGEAAPVREHIANCEACRIEFAQLNLDLAYLSLHAPTTVPSPGARQRFLARVENEASLPGFRKAPPSPARTLVAVPLGTGASQKTAPGGSPADARPTAARRPLIWLPWAVAGVCGLLAIGAGIDNVTLRDRLNSEARARGGEARLVQSVAATANTAGAEVNTLREKLAAQLRFSAVEHTAARRAKEMLAAEQAATERAKGMLTAEQASAERTKGMLAAEQATTQRVQGMLTAEQASAQRAKEVLAVLTSPRAMRVTLTAGKSRPHPTGRATYLKERGQLIFIANNLASLPAGKTYELWLIPISGNPLRAGLFAPDTQGSATLVLPHLPQGIAAKAFGVTIEPEGGSDAPTSAILLQGS